MDGDIDDVIVACRTYFQAEALRQHMQGGAQAAAT